MIDDVLADDEEENKNKDKFRNFIPNLVTPNEKNIPGNIPSNPKTRLGWGFWKS